MKKLIFLFLIYSSIALGQVSIGNINPDPSAILDLTNGISKGFLSPKMTTATRNSIISPAEGLSVYDIDIEGFCYYTSSAGWICIKPNGTNAWAKTTDGTAAAENFTESITRTGDVIITTNSYQIKIEESGGIVLKNTAGTASVRIGSDGKVLLTGATGGVLSVN